MSLIYGRNPLERKRSCDPQFRKKKQSYLSLVRNHLSGTKERKSLLCYLSSCYLCTLEVLSEDKESLQLKAKKESTQKDKDSKENVFLLFSFFPDSVLESERMQFFSSDEIVFSQKQAEKEIFLYNRFLDRIRKKNCILSEKEKINPGLSFYDTHRRDVDNRKLREGKPTCFLEDDGHQLKIILEKKVKISKELYDRVHPVISFTFSVLELKSLSPYQVRIRIESGGRKEYEETFSPSSLNHQISCPIEGKEDEQIIRFAFTLKSKGKESSVGFDLLVS